MSIILSIIFLIQFSFTEEHSILISYNDEEEYEEVFEPLCDINFDGEEDLQVHPDDLQNYMPPRNFINKMMTVKYINFY